MFYILAILIIIGFGAAVFGPRFRRYSIATILVLLVAGTLTFLDAPGVAANRPTPWIGITERINVYRYMLWPALLAAGLLRLPSRGSRAGGTGRAGAVDPALGIRPPA